ncbi:hypothetical protein LshimejAT787_1602410 [Lyophyllum shimeji]|uniref:Uncharacterized protein n=1 Tax=Lyophyllum shimeji TaxID=47721 RepID=A0A9P3Q056_LYOSH|nr:hypothetical protein LshimejAT787_1602410 [Lyophyllum shimeji]
MIARSSPVNESLVAFRLEATRSVARLQARRSETSEYGAAGRQLKGRHSGQLWRETNFWSRLNLHSAF